MIVDLHVHSTHSDGMFSLEKLPHLFSERNLSITAITDHNAIGVPESEINWKNTTTIPNSVELSCEWRNGKEIHLLAYDLKRISSFLESYFEYYTQAKTEQTKKRCQKSLEEPIFLKGGEYLYVSFDDLQKRLERKNAYYWTDIAQILSNKINDILNDEVLTRNDCIGLMVGDEKAIHKGEYIFDTACFIDNPRLWYAPFKVKHVPIAQALSAVKECGGISSLAHPYERKLNIDDIKGIMRQGKLSALEVYSPKNPTEKIEEYLDFCKQERLLISGGTDFHLGDSEDLGQIRGKDIDWKDLSILEYLL